MKGLIIMILAAISVLYACSHADANEVDIVGKNENLIYPGEIIDSGTHYANISRIVSSPIVVGWCNDIVRNPHLQRDFQVLSTALQNPDWPNRTDTIFAYTNDNSKVSVYKAKGRSILMQSEVYEPSILLSGRIHVGSTRDVVIDALGREFGNDTLMVISQDVSTYFELYFDDDVLSGIYYSGRAK